MVTTRHSLFSDDQADNLQALAAEIAPRVKEIRQRDGRVTPFDPNRIYMAIEKASQATGEFDESEAARITASTIRKLGRDSEARRSFIPSIEYIQDQVEETLMESSWKKTAKAYILYRSQHETLRELKIQQDSATIEGYLNKSNWKTKENANMSYSLQGLNQTLSSKLSKTYWLRNVYSSRIREAHERGDLHIHDLGHISVYCVGWDLQDLLLKGFRGASGKVAAAPARHLRSALGQIVNFLYTMQGEAAGAQAFSSFDTYIAPFVKADNLDYQQVKQAMQEFLFNMNVPTRVGGQSPFTNITLDIVCPDHMAFEQAIVGGARQSFRYRDCQHEMNLINRSFCQLMSEGDDEGRPFSFPIPTINIGADFDWDNEELDPLWQMTAKFGIPYFANFVNSDMAPEDTRSMCCRLRLDTSELKRRGGGLFGASPLTGSLGVVTINMPRLGKTCGNLTILKKRLARLMGIAKESLETKRKLLERLTDRNLYPYSNYYLRAIRKRFGKSWINHFSTIGVLGMNEACLNFLGKDVGTSEGQDFAMQILDFMNDRLEQYQAETGNLYNLEATPAEGTSYRLATLDKQRFGHNIACANFARWTLGEATFYTNSSHLPVNYTEDPFEALELQDELQTRYTGGTVLHLFLGESVTDIQSLKSFIRKVVENHRLPYFTVTPTFSVCPSHGYLSGQQNTCPRCHGETEVYSRVVGYLRPVANWNKGKCQEFQKRKLYRIREEAPC